MEKEIMKFAQELGLGKKKPKAGEPSKNGRRYDKIVGTYYATKKQLTLKQLKGRAKAKRARRAR